MSLQIVNGQDVGAAGADAGQPADGRLSVHTTDPVGEVGAPVASLYYHRYVGSRLAVYTGASWVALTIPVGGVVFSLAGIAPGVYDIFAYDSGGGTIALESLAWASLIARATALTRQDGVWVKSGDATRRYIGTIDQDGQAVGTILDFNNSRGVWNCYNRIRRGVKTFDPAPPWMTNGLGTYEFMNHVGPAANPFWTHSFVVGLLEDAVHVTGEVVIVAGPPGARADITFTDAAPPLQAAQATFGGATASPGIPISIAAHYMGLLPSIGRSRIIAVQLDSGVVHTIGGSGPTAPMLSAFWC